VRSGERKAAPGRLTTAPEYGRFEIRHRRGPAPLIAAREGHDGVSAFGEQRRRVSEAVAQSRSRPYWLRQLIPEEPALDGKSRMSQMEERGPPGDAPSPLHAARHGLHQ
jgi:hypothetical protein